MKRIIVLILVVSLAALSACTSQPSHLVEVGPQGAENVELIDLGITDETALIIADAYFSQMHSWGYSGIASIEIVDSSLFAAEFDSEEYITVLASGDSLILDSDDAETIVIRRSDGKVMMRGR